MMIAKLSVPKRSVSRLILIDTCILITCTSETLRDVIRFWRTFGVVQFLTLAGGAQVSWMQVEKSYWHCALFLPWKPLGGPETMRR